MELANDDNLQFISHKVTIITIWTAQISNLTLFYLRDEFVELPAISFHALNMERALHCSPHEPFHSKYVTAPLRVFIEPLAFSDFDDGGWQYLYWMFDIILLGPVK